VSKTISPKRSWGGLCWPSSRSLVTIQTPLFFFCSAASLVSLTCLPVCSVWDPNSLSCFFCPTIAQTDFLPLRL
jgi:hypothetical protein